MKQSFEDFLFSKEERKAVKIAMVVILIASFVTGAIFITSSITLRPVVLGFLIMLVVLFGYLWIDYYRNDKYRSAQYIISDDYIKLICGKEILDISKQDEYYVSVIHLYKPSGKSYIYRPYVVFWKYYEPVNNVHPIHLLKKNCLVLPLTDRTEAAVRSFTETNELSHYPKSFYHAPEKQL